MGREVFTRMATASRRCPLGATRARRMRSNGLSRCASSTVGFHAEPGREKLAHRETLLRTNNVSAPGRLAGTFPRWAAEPNGGGTFDVNGENDVSGFLRSGIGVGEIQRRPFAGAHSPGIKRS